jgi:hypothetical protein
MIIWGRRLRAGHDPSRFPSVIRPNWAVPIVWPPGRSSGGWLIVTWESSVRAGISERVALCGL